VPADLVVVGLGVLPNAELAGAAGIAVDDGILVDQQLRTNMPGVFAAGDVANVAHPVFSSRVRAAHWWTALTQGPVAAANMADQHARYDRVPFFSSKQYDLLVEYTGHASAGDNVVFRGDPATRQFVAFWVNEGRVLVGMTADVAGMTPSFRDLVASGRSVEPAELANPDVDLALLGGQDRSPAPQSGTSPPDSTNHGSGDRHRPWGPAEIDEGLRQWYDSCLNNDLIIDDFDLERRHGENRW
jgi:3-phenylpropionate/trans-cinnamate dioxygenase ferredoxin reductase subunit